MAAVFILSLVWQQGAERRAILRLPPAERQQLFGREWSNFRTLCAPGSEAGPLADRCRSDAEFLAQFPECDRGCQTLLRARLAPPAK